MDNGIVDMQYYPLCFCDKDCKQNNKYAPTFLIHLIPQPVEYFAVDLFYARHDFPFLSCFLLLWWRLSLQLLRGRRYFLSAIELMPWVLRRIYRIMLL